MTTSLTQVLTLSHAGVILLIAQPGIALTQDLAPTEAAGRVAQASSMIGAAERAGKGWPYPEPAQRGATGYSPDYSSYARPSERWDIYVHILWRKTASRAKADLEYYDYELAQFLDSLSDNERVQFKSAHHLLLMLEQIRSNVIKLPHRDATTSCLLFMVKHSGRSDLAADKCEATN
jgi:hypothetical protein